MTIATYIVSVRGVDTMNFSSEDDALEYVSYLAVDTPWKITRRECTETRREVVAEGTNQ